MIEQLLGPTKVLSYIQDEDNNKTCGDLHSNEKTRLLIFQN